MEPAPITTNSAVGGDLFFGKRITNYLTDRWLIRKVTNGEGITNVILNIQAVVPYSVRHHLLLAKSLRDLISIGHVIGLVSVWVVFLPTVEDNCLGLAAGGAQQP